MGGWTNDEAIRRWGEFPDDVLATMDEDGDFGKRHLLNPVLLRMLGDVSGRRVLDAGCGNGYLARMLARRGAEVVGVEPARAMHEYATRREAELAQGIRYLRADLAALPADPPELAGGFDAVVASMVLSPIPDWRPALAACAEWLRPGGLLVFTVNHPCFERLRTVWKEHGEYRLREYLAEYEIEGPYASDFHRPVSSYLNAVVAEGLRLREVAEPGLDPAVAATGPEGVESYVHLPNFLAVAATRD